MGIKQFNKQIADKGIAAELVKGDGYFYFVGEAIDETKVDSSVMVYAFRHLTLDQWWEELRSRIDERK